MPLSHTYPFPFHSIAIAFVFFSLSSSPHHRHHSDHQLLSIMYYNNDLNWLFFHRSCKKVGGSICYTFPRFHSIRLIIISISSRHQLKKTKKKRRFSLRASILLKEETNKGKVNLCPFSLSSLFPFIQSLISNFYLHRQKTRQGKNRK